MGDSYSYGIRNTPHTDFVEIYIYIYYDLLLILLSLELLVAATKNNFLVVVFLLCSFCERALFEVCVFVKASLYYNYNLFIFLVKCSFQHRMLTSA